MNLCLIKNFVIYSKAFNKVLSYSVSKIMRRMLEFTERRFLFINQRVFGNRKHGKKLGIETIIVLYLYFFANVWNFYVEMNH